MKLRYFAFGSNLSSPRLLQRLPDAEVHCVATLERHQLRWHKNSRDLSGKCDIVVTDDPRDIVYGVIYLMTHEEGLELDRYETADFGYQRKQVEVAALHGDTLTAFTYFARDINHDRQPYHWYKEHVLRGALEHDFPPHYVELIRSTPSIDDHDAERHRRELAIYGESS